MTLTRTCCCNTDLFTLYSCAELPQPTVPRYLFKRCDIYELETGNPRANCPAEWNPNPYIVWLMQRTGCTSPQDKVCGSFVSAGEGSLINPLAMTTDAVNAGYQADYDPDLPVVNTCQYCPGGTCGWILGGPNDILAWLTVDDCCSSDCGNFARGTPIACDFLEDGCDLSLSTPLSYSQFSSDNGGTSTISNSLMTVDATLSWGTLPTQWTITSDPSGSDGTYSAKITVPYTCNYSGSFGCFGAGSSGECSTDSFNQTWSVSSSLEVIVSAAVNATACGVGQQVDLLVASAVSSTINSGTAVYDCATSPPGAQYEYRGGLGRFSAQDIGCDKLIRYGANNYMALAFRPSFIDWYRTGGVGTCEPAWDSSGLTSSYGFIEIMTPLPDRDFFCS